MATNPKGRAAGGVARAAKMTPEARSEEARKMARAKAENRKLPRATHGSDEHPLILGEVRIPCYVLEDGTRLLSQRGLMTALKMSHGSTASGETRIVNFAGQPSIVQYSETDLVQALKTPIKFMPTQGGRSAYGYPATILADICDAVLAARASAKLPAAYSNVAAQCEVLVRGFARVGIIALVDEATGYQKDRAKDALAKILEAFVAKEIQPYLRTFPADYYEQLFRLYKLPYPPEGNKSWRPAFFGHITNDVVYSRLAPELLPELKKAASKAEKKAKLHQWLTQETGHPKLREHLSSVVTIMKLSKGPEDFKQNVNAIHPKFGDTMEIDFGSPQ